MRAITALLLLCLCSVATAAGQPYRFGDVDRIVAFGDVHGAYDELVSLLQAAGVLDDRLRWSGGATHVVSLGDLLDRGADSRAVMDLLMRLQGEAQQAGGRLHVVLGNHEVLNLTGDLRYVSDGEYAAFADDEDPAERAAAKATFATRFADPAAAEAAFAEEFPAGYFGLRAALRPDGQYGRWLLQLPVMLQIDATVFVHGGLPPVVAELGLDAVNRQLGSDLAEFVSLWQALREQGLIAFDQAADLAAVELDKLFESEIPPAVDPATLTKVRRFTELAQSTVFAARGPLWYRGSARCHPLLETDVVDAALARLDAQRVVIGHTPTPSRRATTRLDDRVIMIDSGMLAAYYDGTPVALVIDKGRTSVVYPRLPAVSEPVRYEHDNAADWGGDLADLERFLGTAEIVPQAQDAPGQRDFVRLRAADGREAEATVIERAATARRELAAYALDRLLGLGIVPVTVARTVDGRDVALQLRRGDWIDEPTRVERQLPLTNWCAAGNNFELMYVLDALTANDRSDRATIQYSPDRERLWVTGFASAFSTAGKLPRYLAGEADNIRISGEAARRLAALDSGALELALGDLLSKRERRALLQRRDAILAQWKIR